MGFKFSTINKVCLNLRREANTKLGREKNTPSLQISLEYVPLMIKIS